MADPELAGQNVDLIEFIPRDESSEFDPQRVLFAEGDVTAKQRRLSAANNSASYGEFATAAASISLPREPELKPPGSKSSMRWRLMRTRHF